METISDALVRLGMRQVRALVVARSMIGAMGQGPPTIDLSYFWRRSLATGVLASRLVEGVAPTQRDRAFIAGLLCDVGVLILARAIPERYSPIAASYAPQRSDDLVIRERELLGVTHAEVSALALQRWSLPEELTLAVQHHHAEPAAPLPDGVGRIARLLSGADEIARLLCEAPQADVVRERCAWATDRIGLSVSVLPAVLKQVEGDIADLAAALRVELIPSRVYAIIADTIVEQLTHASASNAVA
jgi:HD-like signal output (HDOD) protein